MDPGTEKIGQFLDTRSETDIFWIQKDDQRRLHKTIQNQIQCWPKKKASLNLANISTTEDRILMKFESETHNRVKDHHKHFSKDP